MTARVLTPTRRNPLTTLKFRHVPADDLNI